MQITLKKLFQSKKLNQKESYKLFNAIISNKLKPTELIAALIAMKIRGESPEEIAGAVYALLENAHPFPRPNYNFADIVGTGGDNSNSINISTASAFVAATCGLKIAKHGNRAVSSKIGSFDILEKFGINFNKNANQSRKDIDRLNLCFLFSQKYYPTFRVTMILRKELKTRTIFNILGTLINPARPKFALIGVHNKNLISPIAKTLKILNYKSAAVVHSGGMDEITLHSPTYVAELCKKKIDYYKLIPKNFGFNFYPKKSLIGNSKKENFYFFKNLLRGKGEQSHEQTVAANVAMLLKIFGYQNLRDNAQHVLSIIQSGQPYERLIDLSER